MDWITSVISDLLEHFADFVELVDRHIDLPKVVLVCAVLLAVFSFALTRSRR